jgi:uncharacterized protein
MNTELPGPEKFYPEAIELESYGNGGFRFGEMSHRGSLLILQSGIYAWDYQRYEDVDLTAFDLLFREASETEFLLFGTGGEQRFPSSEMKAAFSAAGLGLEVMDTGAAARTFNVLINEGRKVAAALIAVE